MDSDLQRYLDDLVAAARDVLGADLVGAYAAGSVGLGAYQAGRSDVDVVLVSAGPLTDTAKRALVARLRHEALPCPARGLELVAYDRAVAASGTPEPGFEVEINTGAGMPFRCTLDPADRPAADGRFWYGLDRSILHQSGLPLLGPPAGRSSPTSPRPTCVDCSSRRCPGGWPCRHHRGTNPRPARRTRCSARAGRWCDTATASGSRRWRPANDWSTPVTGPR